MHSFEKMFPSLALFSDINWDAVTQEYESEYIDLSFPEYLQEKALDGDCPMYLFELAYYELALFDANTSNEKFPHTSGVYLNPTALFLSLEFDVKKMIDDAGRGLIEVHERPHVLSIYRDTHDLVKIQEVSEEELVFLQKLEDGPQKDSSFVEKGERAIFQNFEKSGLILEIK